jgi:hypothetical protein
MRKQISKRKWKARCRIGREIPLTEIVNHRLNTWFDFDYAPHGEYTYFFVARGKQF